MSKEKRPPEKELHPAAPAAAGDGSGHLQRQLDEATEREQLLELARASEQQGALDIAVSAYNRLLADDEQDREALWGLAQLRIDNGQTGRALLCLERLAATGDARAAELRDSLREETALEEQPEAGQQDNDGQPPVFTDADLVLLCELFSGRQGVHARQWSSPDGRYGYAPVMAPLTPALMRQHLLGACTLGVYPIDHAGRVRFLALDIDLDTPPEQLGAGLLAEAMKLALGLAMRLGKILRDLGLEPLLEFSGYKGFHLWVLFAEPWPAGRARRLGRAVSAACACPPGIHVEVFPAQERVRKGGLGNLIKLPLGVHLKSGRRSRLLDEQGRELGDVFGHLRAAGRVSVEVLEAACERAAGLPRAEKAGTAPARKQEPAPAENRAEAPEPPGRSVALEPPYDPRADEQLSFLSLRCPILGTLVEKALRGEGLTHDEQAVLRYTIGHLDDGPRAINHLFERAGCLDDSSRMIGRFKGNPASCMRIRSRLNIPADDDTCRCQFDATLGHYPHPLLHLAAQRAERRIVEIRDDRAALSREYARVQSELDRLQRLARELQQQGATGAGSHLQLVPEAGAGDASTGQEGGEAG